MKIAFVLSDLKTGGAEMLTLRLAGVLSEAGHEVLVIGTGSSASLVPLLDESAVRWRVFEQRRGVSLRLVRELRALLRRERVDLVLSNHFRQLLHCRPAVIGLGIRLCHIEHDNLIYRHSSKYLLLLRLLSCGLFRLVVISETLACWYGRQLPRLQRRGRLVTIANGIDTELFCPDAGVKARFRRDRGLGAAHLLFGSVARLEPVKNLALMLAIFAELHRRWPQSSLVLVGEGSLRLRLEEEAAQLGIGGAVIFAGLQMQTAPWFQAMDLYLLTSDDEGLPLAVLEGLACGVPVLSRAVGDLPRVVQPAFGRLLTETTAAAWVTAAEELLEGEEPFAARARAEVVRSYSFSSCARSWLRLVEEAQRC